MKAKTVKKTNDYYVRIETKSREGVKLVGNVGPFAISPQQFRRRDDPSADEALKVDFALKPEGPSGERDELTPNPVDLTA